MPTEIYNNFTVNKKAHLDNKLETVTTVPNLPDPNLGTNFIYEGAEVYVSGEKATYQAQDDPDNTGTLIWVRTGGDTTALVTGTVTISSTATILDLATVSPLIATCDAVLIKVIGGDTVSINSMLNCPADQPIKFTAFTGQTVTFNHTEIADAGSNDIILELPYPYSMVGRSNADESLTLVKEGGRGIGKASANTLSQVTGEQFVSQAEIIAALSDLSTNITDNLTSTSIIDGLSANQGRILANMISNVNNFQVDGSLSWNADNTILTGGYTGFIETIAPDGTKNVLNYLTNSIASIGSHRLVKFTNSGTSDDGVWLIGAGQNPAIASNWIQISESSNQVRPWAIYDITSSGTVDNDAETNGDYFLRFSETPISSDGLLQSTFNNSGATEKVNIKLPVGKTYSIEVHVSLSTSGQGQFFLDSHSSSSFGTLADAIPGTKGITTGAPVYMGITNLSNVNSLLPYAVTANYSDIVKLEQGDNNIFSFAWGQTVTPTATDRTVLGGGRIIIKEITPGS